MKTIQAGPRDPASALWYAGLLQALHLGVAPTSLLGYVTGDGWNVSQSMYRPQSGNTPAWFACFMEGSLLLAVDGMTTLAQLQAVLSQYAAGPAGPGRRFDGNGVFLDAVADIDTQMSAYLPTYFGQAYLCGYSMGGAIAELFPRQFMFDSLDTACDTCTFGAPRATSFLGCEQFRSLSSIGRWMNTDDPIPLVPPRFADAPVLAISFGVIALNQMALYVQSGGGLDIGPLGSVVSQDLPSAASVNLSGSLASWLLGVISTPLVAHSLPEYQRRINISVPATVAVRRLPYVAIEPPARAHSTEVNRQAEATTSAVFAIERQQNEAIQLIPASQTVYAFREGRIWFLGFGDTTICVVGSKRKARALARELNSFLRNLQTAAIVDPSAILSQLGLYLQAAQTPANGFTPVMNVTFPP